MKKGMSTSSIGIIAAIAVACVVGFMTYQNMAQTSPEMSLESELGLDVIAIGYEKYCVPLWMLEHFSEEPIEQCTGDDCDYEIRTIVQEGISMDWFCIINVPVQHEIDALNMSFGD